LRFILLVGDENNITFLDEHVFEPFLNDNQFEKGSGNTISMLSSLDCNDCRNYWLVKNQNYKTKLTESKYSDNETITDSSNFKLCIS
jgi:hypothetical protein